MTNRARFVSVIWSSLRDKTFTPVDAAASITFGAGYEPAVTKASIWPFFRAGTAFDSSTSARVTLPSKPNSLRYFSPSLAPKDPLPRRTVFPSRSAKLLMPASARVTKCMVRDGIGNKARISSKAGSPFPSNIALPPCARRTRAGGVVNT